MSNQLQDWFITPENNQLDILLKALEYGVDFKNRKEVIQYLEPQEVKEMARECIPLEGLPLDQILEDFNDKLIPHFTNFASPSFVAFPDSANAVAPQVANLLLGMTNQNLINSRYCAPVATYIEIQVIQWLRELLGFKVYDYEDIFGVGGIAVTGGTLSNATALMLAREKVFPGTKDSGLKEDPGKIRILLPEAIDHYSMRVAMGWLGLGERNILYVKIKDDYTLDLDDLETKIQENCENFHLLSICAYAGDSRTMAFDDFEKIASIAQKYNIWFHVDACHGFALSFSERFKHKIKGIEMADSVSLDPHKVLWIPYNLSFLLTKDPQVFRTVVGSSDLINKEHMAFGQMTPFLGSKSFMSLKLYFLMKHIGVKEMGKLIDRRFELATYFADRISKVRGFIQVNNVSFNSVVFVYIPEELSSTEDELIFNLVCRLQKNIHNRVFTEGKYYIHTFTLPDAGARLSSDRTRNWQVLRVFIGNPLCNKNLLDDFADYLVEVAREESSKMNTFHIK